MKKIVFAFGLIVAVVMTACTPETRNQMLGIPDDAILLSTENFIGNDTKASVSNTSVQWRSGDSVAFWNSSTKQTRLVTVNNGIAYIATSLSGSGVIRGYYSTGTTSGNKDNPNVIIPSEYECSIDAQGRQVIALPMVGRADAGSTAIQFKHLTAAVNVKLKNSTGRILYVDEVDVISEAYRLYENVSFAINLTVGDLGIGSNSGTTKNKVKVTFPAGDFIVPINSDDKVVQVPIRPIGDDYLTIKVYCHDGESNNYVYSYRPDSIVQALGRNEMLTAKVNLSTSGNMLAGNEVDLSTKNADFTANDGDILYGTPGKSLVCSIPENATVAIKGVNATSSKSLVLKAVGNNATILIEGSNVLYGTPAITVTTGNTLTIGGKGSLNVTAGYGAAAIGSNTSNVCGNIIINSGKITAVASGGNAAAIGCGSYYNCGAITINGGNITATGSNAAGIGSTNGLSDHTCGNITIAGGTVVANGGTGSAGIGTGNVRYSHCGNISISGGTVIATGNNGAAGIGTGACDNSLNSCGSITITSGVDSVNVIKGTGAFKSIGRGNETSTVGTVTVMGVEGEKTDNYTYRRPSSK